MTTSTAIDDTALKERHRAVWASGDYPAVARVIAALGPTLVRACRTTSRDRVLDVAAGAGNAAIPAAALGADVIACDLTPELLADGQDEAAEFGIELRWEQADAERLPYPDGRFDVVMSCVGVMFAPHHRTAADELARVCAPGGRLGLMNWTPSGFVGQLFAAMAPYVAPPAPGAEPPPLWGDPAHVVPLLDDHFELSLERRTLIVTRFDTGADFRDFFRRAYGPTVAAYRGLADDPERTAALDAALVEVAERFRSDRGMEWEYLLVTGIRRTGSAGTLDG